MGALVECELPVAPGTELTIDIVGVGPVRGVVRWAQSGKFGVQFDQPVRPRAASRPSEKSSIEVRCCARLTSTSATASAA